MDASTNKSTVSNGNFTTSDITPPTLSSVGSSNIAGTTADIAATSNEDGTMYYVITTSSSSPTNTQVVAGQDNLGAAAFKAGNASVTATVAKTFNLTGLSALTQYYYYIVAVDGSTNKSTVSSGNFTTSGDYIIRYKFENNANDSAGTKHLSTDSGTPTYSSSSPKEGSYYLSLNESSALKYASYNHSTNAITISAWVYLDSTGTETDPTVIDWNNLGFYYTKSSIKFTASLTASDFFTSSSTYSTNTWLHVVMTWDGSNFKLYINGSSQGSQGASANITGTNDLLIGKYSSGLYWKGKIDDVQIYSRALSSSEVTSLYNSY